ncbi:MAG TPA: hypothetical protein VIB00_17290 [Pyrinomonadaceae bacterium]
MLFQLTYQFPLFLLIAWWFFCRRAENAGIHLVPTLLDASVLGVAFMRFHGSDPAVAACRIPCGKPMAYR